MSFCKCDMLGLTLQVLWEFFQEPEDAVRHIPPQHAGKGSDFIGQVSQR